MVESKDKNLKMIVGTAGALGGAAIVGGLAGQICDILPYINHAIPEGIGYVAGYFTDADKVKAATEALDGNLDKVGAAIGFYTGLRDYIQHII